MDINTPAIRLLNYLITNLTTPFGDKITSVSQKRSDFPGHSSDLLTGIGIEDNTIYNDMMNRSVSLGFEGCNPDGSAMIFPELSSARNTIQILWRFINIKTDLKLTRFEGLIGKSFDIPPDADDTLSVQMSPLDQPGYYQLEVVAAQDRFL